MERASKIAHMSLIRDPSLTQLLQSFHSDTVPRRPSGAARTGTIDLSLPEDVHHVVTVDGGYTVAPNPIRRDKALSLIQVGTSILSINDLERLERDPMMDPRDVVQMLRQVDYRPAALPLAGVRLPGQTIRQTNRIILNAIFAPAWTNLYDVLEYLLWRGWLPAHEARPPRTMNCLNCDEVFSLPRGQTFQCPHCSYDHYLSDYLDLFGDQPEDRSREQVASMVMAAVETLALFELPVKLAERGHLQRLAAFLFIKDGPLMFRAGGYRLTDSLRDFVEWLYAEGYVLNLVGVEKTGDFADFLNDSPDLLPTPGDFFVPSVQFMQEEVRGTRFDPTTYRNRVSYGSRVGVRLSPEHLVALQVPTKSMSDTGPTTPAPSDLIRLETVVRTLARLTSAAHDNALVPLVLANQAVSLSDKPSSRILDDFINSLIRQLP
jgi:hypothetical protein